MSSRARLSRRTALASLALVPLALTACDIDPPRHQDPSARTAPAPDADSVLVGSVLTSIGAAEAVVDAVRTSVPGLRRPLRPLALAHASHLRRLAGAAPDVADTPAGPVTVTGGRDEALALVLRSEQRLGRMAGRASAGASSGPLARALASLAASAEQHAAALAVSSPTPGSRPPTDAPDASQAEPLQQALVAEHASLHLYGVLGARTSAAGEPALFDVVSAAYRQHRSRRDQLTAWLREIGTEPSPAAAVYAVPDDLDAPDAVAAAGLAMEEQGAATMAALVAQTTGDVRRWAGAELVWSAVRQLDLGGQPVAWPGAPDLETP